MDWKIYRPLRYREEGNVRDELDAVIEECWEDGASLGEILAAFYGAVGSLLDGEYDGIKPEWRNGKRPEIPHFHRDLSNHNDESLEEGEEPAASMNPNA